MRLLRNVRSNRTLLSSDSEGDLNADNPKPVPSNLQVRTRLRSHGRPPQQPPTTSLPIPGNATDSEPSGNDSDRRAHVVENNDPGYDHNKSRGPKHCPLRNSPPINYFGLFFSFAF
ncbi:hypothetical protein J6590_098809 [Homalodisca vitripennis]|nr:hypothetical protein J6590_098809 [Homalodisca vitripennis]